uniref:Secreted protein n=1 Tax=Oryza glumipatula TaxID=40148 RepID=A0A0D9YQP9_9ORYZ
LSSSFLCFSFSFFLYLARPSQLVLPRANPVPHCAALARARAQLVPARASHTLARAHTRPIDGRIPGRHLQLPAFKTL